MSKGRIHRKIERTPEDKARLEAVRSRFQNERPTMEQLVASGEYGEPVPLGEYLEVRRALATLRREREGAGLSLAEVAARSGIDKAALSRLENGKQPNPTLATLYRYAAAIGKQIVLGFQDTTDESVGREAVAK